MLKPIALQSEYLPPTHSQNSKMISSAIPNFFTAAGNDIYNSNTGNIGIGTGAGALLIVDEIQCGVGRTGAWFAHQRSGVVPDAMTLAKGLGGGVPIGALVTFGERVTGLLEAGQHGTTFGGNPLACAAGLAVLDTIERDDLLEHVVTIGALLDDLDIEGVAATRGRGLMRAIELDGIRAPAAVDAAREAGFIVNAVTPTALRLTPPLVISAAELRLFLAALPAILEAAKAAGP